MRHSQLTAKATLSQLHQHLGLWRVEGCTANDCCFFLQESLFFFFIKLIYWPKITWKLVLLSWSCLSTIGQPCLGAKKNLLQAHSVRCSVCKSMERTSVVLVIKCSVQMLNFSLCVAMATVKHVKGTRFYVWEVSHLIEWARSCSSLAKLELTLAH